MPEKKTIERARKDAREGKSPGTPIIENFTYKLEETKVPTRKR